MQESWAGIVLSSFDLLASIQKFFHNIRTSPYSSISFLSTRTSPEKAADIYCKHFIRYTDIEIFFLNPTKISRDFFFYICILPDSWSSDVPVIILEARLWFFFFFNQTNLIVLLILEIMQLTCQKTIDVNNDVTCSSLTCLQSKAKVKANWSMRVVLRLPVISQ